MRTELLRFNGAVERDPAIDACMKEHTGELGAIAQQWFEVMRKCGDEVRELLHDGCPVACLGDAPFGDVNVFTSHVNVGFFHGAALPDPARLLQGTGKFMRHIKARVENGWLRGNRLRTLGQTGRLPNSNSQEPMNVTSAPKFTEVSRRIKAPREHKQEVREMPKVKVQI